MGDVILLLELRMVLQELQSRLHTGLSGGTAGVVERRLGSGLKSEELSVTSRCKILIKSLQTANFPG